MADLWARRFFCPLVLLVALAFASAVLGDKPDAPALTVAKSRSVPSEIPTKATVYTAKLPQGIQGNAAKMEQIARERGSIEVVEFVASGNPLVPDKRVLLRLGEPELGFPGFSMNMRKALTDSISSKLLKPGKKPQTFLSTNPTSPELIECTLPKSDADAFSATVKLNGVVKMRIRQYELPLGPNGVSWPSSIWVTVPDKGVILQIFDYGSTPDLLVPERGIWGLSDFEGTGLLPPGTDGLRGTDAVSFSADWGWSTGWDSGYQPPGFPVQVRIGFGGGLGIDGDVSCNFSMSGGPQLMRGLWIIVDMRGYRSGSNRASVC